MEATALPGGPGSNFFPGVPVTFRSSFSYQRMTYSRGVPECQLDLFTNLRHLAQKPVMLLDLAPAFDPFG